MARRNKDSRMDRLGVEGFNIPKRTPYHPRNSHVVLAKEGTVIRPIRFGKQGTSKDSTPASNTVPRGRLSAAYWVDKVDW